MESDVISLVLICAFLSIAIFLIIRTFILWYFKINERLCEQKKTNELLQDLYDAIVQENTVNDMTADRFMGMNETVNEQYSNNYKRF